MDRYAGKESKTREKGREGYWKGMLGRRDRTEGIGSKE